MIEEMMITDEIINTDFLDENLIKIIPSIIVLDQDLKIISVSADVAKLLYYQPHEMMNTEVFEIFRPSDYSFLNNIDELKRRGYFQKKKIILLNKYRREVLVEISGFYLGLLSDSGNSIILNIRDIDKLKTYQNLFQDKVAEFNELVYRTYHDLRGPVATIKGLINVSKYNTNEEEHNKTYGLINQSADLLNARLSNISAIFDAADTPSNIEISDFYKVEVACKKLLKEQFAEEKVSFKMSAHQIGIEEMQDEVFLFILRNIIQSLDNCNIVNRQPSITTSFQSSQNMTQMQCDIEGFDVDYGDYENILNHNFNFSQIINNENLLRIYILNNYIQKYNGNIYASILEGNIWSINILIPKD